MDQAASDWLRPFADTPETRPTAAGRSSVMSSPPVRMGRIRGANERQAEVLMTDERRSLNPPPLPSEQGGVSALTREEQGIVGGRPPLQHEGDEEKQSAHDPLGRIKPPRETECCCSAILMRTHMFKN